MLGMCIKPRDKAYLGRSWPWQEESAKYRTDGERHQYLHEHSGTGLQLCRHEMSPSWSAVLNAVPSRNSLICLDQD